MVKLDKLDVNKVDKGHIQACGKARRGEDLYEACVVFSAVDGRPLPLESSGDPEVQDEIIRRMSSRIKVR